MKWRAIATLWIGVATAAAAERVDLDAIRAIKDEGMQRSQVMELAYNLTDRFGPRLLNTPEFRAAGEWAARQLTEWSVSNVKLEKFDSGIPAWRLKRYYGAMVEPSYQPIIGLPAAWTAGTHGPVTGEAIVAEVRTLADLDKYKGKLAGKVVLISPVPDLTLPTAPLATRYSPEDLLKLVNLSPAAGGRGGGGRGGNPRDARAFAQLVRSFWKAENALLTVTATASGQSGTYAVQGAANRNDATNLPSVAITAEHYTRIVRLLQHGVPVKLQFDIETEWDKDNTASFNVIAELPGTSKKNEVVMLGAHLDSWHAGTGATDNAAGAAAGMEVMRVLKKLNLPLDRTVRLALWGGEEEGLLGSRAYVKEHFTDPAEHAKLAAYFNVDNGSGGIRGLYLQGNESTRPVFESWFAALKDLTPGVVSIRSTRDTDHQSFEDVGLPAFPFIQDPLDYDTRTHHTNMDTYDRLQAADLKQIAVIEAAFVYQAATRPEKLPRKELSRK
jgi:carboxypeptidase Q